MAEAMCTGPRGQQYGFSEGVISRAAAERYVGRDASEESDAWDELGAEDWDFDEDEGGLREQGLLWELAVSPDGTFGLVRLGG